MVKTVNILINHEEKCSCNLKKLIFKRYFNFFLSYLVQSFFFLQAVKANAYGMKIC